MVKMYPLIKYEVTMGTMYSRVTSAVPYMVMMTLLLPEFGCAICFIEMPKT